MPPTSFVRWMSITSCLSFRIFAGRSSSRVRSLILCKSLPSGLVVVSSSPSVSMRSLSESSEEAFCLASLFLLFFVDRTEGFAHSGVGYRRSYCLRSLLVYSFPLTISSASLTLSFRNLELFASDTVMRSSSLSSHAALGFPADEFSLSDVWTSSWVPCAKVSGPESRKNSYIAWSAAQSFCCWTKPTFASSTSPSPSSPPDCVSPSSASLS